MLCSICSFFYFYLSSFQNLKIQKIYGASLIFLFQYAILFAYLECHISTFATEIREVTYYCEQKDLSLMRTTKKRHILRS